MKSKTNFSSNKLYLDFCKKLHDKVNKSELKKAKRVVWENYENKDVPITFANRIQEIDDVNKFNEETQQLFTYLVFHHEEFKKLESLKDNEQYEIINFMSPGQDKPSHLVKWDKCLIASICCGTAPTEDQYNDTTHDQIKFSLIKSGILPLIYYLYDYVKNVKKINNLKIVKNSKESNIKNLKKNCFFYVHTLSFVKHEEIDEHEDKEYNYKNNDDSIVEDVDNYYYGYDDYDLLLKELAELSFQRGLINNYSNCLQQALDEIENKIKNIDCFPVEG
jgi:hypothetical protein